MTTTKRALLAAALSAAIGAAAAWSACRGVAAVPLAQLAAVEDELANQAGASDADRKLLDAMAAAARTPAERAEVLRRSCGLLAAVSGPRDALAHCAQALVAGRSAGPAAHHLAGRRLSLVLCGAGDPVGALALLGGLPPAPSALDGVLTGWARARALRDLGRAPEAASAARAARSELEGAVAADPRLGEYLAVADYELGRALAAAGDRAGARSALLRALALQRTLDARNPEYAEYALYLARILRELGRLPGGESDARGAAELGAALLARDPLRWEYREVVGAVQ